MTESPATAEVPSSSSIGQTLRHRRLQRDLTLEKCAQDTKIHIKFLRALEEERWADFPARVYMEGFFKRYAGYLGLDSEEMVKQLRRLIQETEKPGFSSPAPREEDTEGRPMTPAPGRPLWLLAGGGALVAALALAYVKMEERRMVAEHPTAPVETFAAPPVPPEPPAPVAHDVMISARTPVWVRVWVDDQVKFEGILQAGQNKSWSAQKKLRVMAGNANLVRVQVDGQPVAPRAGGPAGEIHWAQEAAPQAAPSPVQIQPQQPQSQPQAPKSDIPAPDKRQ